MMNIEKFGCFTLLNFFDKSLARSVISGALSIVLLCATQAHALSPETLPPAAAQHKQLPLAEQRYHYEMAKQALNDGRWQTFDTHYALLGDYPLVPYLEYSKLKFNLDKLEMDKLEGFLRKHENSFLETRLREQLLYTLAIKKRWEDYLAYYDPAKSTQELSCYWLYARLHEHDTSAYQEVADIWQQGKSHPKTCDPLFNRWRRAGGLTQDIAWTRFDNAMHAGKRSLARYVTSFMDEKHQKYAELYMHVHGYPYTIRQQQKFSEHSPQMQQIIAYGIQRYARHNALDALKQWEKYEAQQIFAENLVAETKLQLAKRLIRSDNAQAAEALISNSPALGENTVVEAFIRDSLQVQNWERVYHWINKLDNDAQNSDRWRYWRARALEQLSVHDDAMGSAHDIYLALSKQRSFHGFLAADKVERSYSLEQIPVELSPSTLLAVEQLPGLRRARELWLKGEMAEARAEWFFTTRNLESDDLVAAGELAKRWGWYNKGIHAMITGNLWDHLSIRFPLAYEEQVQQVSSQTKVAPDFIFAVARQESAFAENATSSAGAMGLMQLMPQTAKLTAMRNGIKHTKKDLFDPEHNINLGGHYLNELLEQYNGNRILAAAAYNAGPHRVDRWIRKNPQDVPYDIWIETIPFKETRGYVQNVLAFSVIYGYRLGQPKNLVTETEAKSLL
ncbi:soluble lytic murein transglycosylase [Alteromonadaceae bacterium 2753L.S.0a.02]|nr:soluble lytic murein transglycosylase [Alteromonadaceae bacterium 2753L.S.0a.02]